MTSHAYDRKKVEIVLSIAGDILNDTMDFYRELEEVKT